MALNRSSLATVASTSEQSSGTSSPREIGAQLRSMLCHHGYVEDFHAWRERRRWLKAELVHGLDHVVRGHAVARHGRDEKATLLARLLPIPLVPDLTDEKALLPIETVMVGPGIGQDVTRIAVGDLLLKYGYDPGLVTKSVVPYRVP